MIRSIALCTSLLIASAAFAQLTPASRQQSPQPLGTSGIRTASVEVIDRLTVERELLNQKIAERDRLQREIDALRQTTRTAQQILVRLQAIEVSRTKLRKLGVDVATTSGNQAIASSLQQAFTIDATADKKEAKTQVFESTDTVFSFIRVLRENNIAKVLAEPSLVTVSGRPASFLVGGEFPIPALAGSECLFDFMKFGTQVDLLAISQGNNKVRLELRVRLSDLDYEHAMTIEGKQVPAMHVRAIDTAIELSAGQTGLITGLIEQRPATMQDKEGASPGEEEVELLFVVTPELVASKAQTTSTGKQTAK
jgi:pilus assembly protein CpaC